MSKIEWTEKTWNPTTGCTKVSEGCRNCYAESVAKRFWGDRKFDDVQFHQERLDTPLRRKKPTMWFVNSMSDLFHPDIPFDALCDIFEVMVSTPRHIYQILTKRPERMAKLIPLIDAELCAREGMPVPEDADFPENIWLGVSVENQKAADERILHLLNTPAAVRFLSCEPLLGAVNLRPWLKSLNWVIVGGESGSNARPCKLEWMEDILHQCQSSGTKVFVKQLGSDYKGKIFKQPSDPKNANLKSFPESLRIREFPLV